MAKGWSRERKRHSLAARGVKTSAAKITDRGFALSSSTVRALVSSPRIDEGWYETTYLSDDYAKAKAFYDSLRDAKLISVGNTYRVIYNYNSLLLLIAKSSVGKSENEFRPGEYVYYLKQTNGKLVTGKDGLPVIFDSRAKANQAKRKARSMMD